MTIVSPAPPVKVTPRERLIADLRAMADWLEANPEVPADRAARASYCALGGDVAEIERIASLVGATVQSHVAADGATHHTVSASVGGGGIYEAFTIVRTTESEATR